LSIAREPNRSALLRETGRQASTRLAAIDARIHSQRYAGVQYATDGEGIHRATLYSSSPGVPKFFPRRLRRRNATQPLENADKEAWAASQYFRRPVSQQSSQKLFGRRIVADQRPRASGRSRSATRARGSLSRRTGRW